MCDTHEDGAELRELNRYKRTNAALFRLLEYATHHNARELLQEFLNEAEALTGSSIGFYHYVEEDQNTLSLQTWSTNTLKHCSAPGAGTHYPIEKAGVWVDCVRRGAPVIHNDYAKLANKRGLPEGHAEVIRELVVPVIRGGVLKAILGVGNKPEPYDESDQQVVAQLAGLAWETVERKRREEERDTLQKELAQSQKLESIGRLAGGVAHDYNNMLTVIQGHLDLALDTLGEESEVYSDLQEALRAAERSALLTRQLLTFARKQNVQPRQVQVNESVEEMLCMLRRLLGENLDLCWQPNPEPITVCIDPTQLDQVLANLCVNARDAISGAGRVMVRTRMILLDQRACAGHTGVLPGMFMLLSVADDGCGIRPEHLSRIFDPFYTSKEVGQGTGLGLATVYGIVRQNKGFIEVESTPDKGSTFNVYLPIASSTEEENNSTLRQARSQGGRENILLVEDEPMLLSLATRVLHSYGYRVFPASGAEQAIGLGGRMLGMIDLLITDVVMPLQNGIDLARHLKRSTPEMKVLLVSAYPAQVLSEGEDLRSCTYFLQKPFSPNDLALKVRQVLDGGTLPEYAMEQSASGRAAAKS